MFFSQKYFYLCSYYFENGCFTHSDNDERNGSDGRDLDTFLNMGVLNYNIPDINHHEMTGMVSLSTEASGMGGYNESLKQWLACQQQELLLTKTLLEQQSKQRAIAAFHQQPMQTHQAAQGQNFQQMTLMME